MTKVFKTSTVPCFDRPAARVGMAHTGPARTDKKTKGRTEEEEKREREGKREGKGREGKEVETMETPLVATGGL